MWIIQIDDLMLNDRVKSHDTNISMYLKTQRKILVLDKIIYWITFFIVGLSKFNVAKQVTFREFQN